MLKVTCSVDESKVNPLFEVFDGGDFILSSYRDIEKPLAEMRIFCEEGAEEAKKALEAALEVVEVKAEVTVEEVPDEDWKFAYRRHFKTELVSPRILVQPEWEQVAVIKFDPGMAFGTGKHETTKACLQFIDELTSQTSQTSQISYTSLLDMGCGSGILSIAAKKLGVETVIGFDVDQDAVDSSIENAAKNGTEIEFFKYGLGAKVKKELPKADIVVANILGPLLIRFADEIVPCVKDKLIISGILTELYPEVLAAYEAKGLKEIERKTIGEWTTGLLSI